jgi:hypothetical protein
LEERNKPLSETDDSQADSVLRVVDGIVTVGIMAMVVGIVLFILFPAESFGATSPREFGASASVTTTLQPFQGPERPHLEMMGKERVNLNLEKTGAVRMPSQDRLQWKSGSRTSPEQQGRLATFSSQVTPYNRQ